MVGLQPDVSSARLRLGWLLKIRLDVLPQENLVAVLNRPLHIIKRCFLLCAAPLQVLIEFSKLFFVDSVLKIIADLVQGRKNWQGHSKLLVLRHRDTIALIQPKLPPHRRQVPVFKLQERYVTISVLETDMQRMRHDHELFQREHTINVKFESTHLLALVLNVTLDVFDFINNLVGLHSLLALFLLVFSLIFEEPFCHVYAELIDLVANFIEVPCDKRSQNFLI